MGGSGWVGVGGVGVGVRRGSSGLRFPQQVAPHVAMGQNPNRIAPGEHQPIQPRKLVLQWGGAPTPKWDPIGVVKIR